MFVLRSSTASPQPRPPENPQASLNREAAQHYLPKDTNFILVGADAALLARGSEAITNQFVRPSAGNTPALYGQPRTFQ